MRLLRGVAAGRVTPMRADRHPGRAATGLAGVWIIATVTMCAMAVATDRDNSAAIDALDRGWSERGDAAALERAVTIGTAAFAAAPSSYDIAWRLARVCWR